jgi:cytochrome b6-f complex iron-sulfur subunit
MNRKKFIKGLTLIAAVGISPAVLESCAPVIYLNYSTNEDKIVVKKTDFIDNQFALINTPNLPAPIYLRNTVKNTYIALLTLCTHKGCTVDAYYDTLSCPCHGSEYSYTGEVMAPPAKDPLIKFRVTTDQDNIYIHLKGN